MKSGPHLTWFNCPEDQLCPFDPIVTELERRLNGQGSGSLFPHHIAAKVLNTRADFFECTSMVSPAIESQLNEWLSRCPHSDLNRRRCIRALANVYQTSLQRSSKDCKPLLEPHRDNVNEADITLVIGFTPTTEYRGSVLYVSSHVKEGKLWFEKEDTPSRKSVQAVDMCRGVCVVLRNNVEHYVSTLQSGKRISLVFHMTPQ